jgi:hypothetical protein
VEVSNNQYKDVIGAMQSLPACRLQPLQAVRAQVMVVRLAQFEPSSIDQGDVSCHYFSQAQPSHLCSCNRQRG